MAAKPRKPFLLRLSPHVLAAVEQLAAAELRSANAQFEVLLREALARRGIKLDLTKPEEQPEGKA
jgi:hypothetical protein